MTLYQFLIDFVKQNDNRKIAYITKNKEKLAEAHAALVEGCDVAASSSRVFGVHPIGVGGLPTGIDVALYEKGETSEEHLLRHIPFSGKFFIYEVDGMDTELVYAEDRIAKEVGNK